MPKRVLIFVALLAAVTPYMSAQRTAFHGFSRGPFNRIGSARSLSFAYPLAFSDPLYSGFLSSTGYPVASLPPFILLQAAPPAAQTAERLSPPPQPLMIELQGNRYVRVSGEESSGAEIIEPEKIEPEKIEPGKNEPEKIDQIRASRPSRPLSEKPSEAPLRSMRPADVAPAVLVFRDGHREEVSGYTIAGGVLYASADYYAGGSWNKKVELSSLNLPETIQSNQSRGVKFQLPDAPNEIIVGP
jgi:hypothetical protein